MMSISRTTTRWNQTRRFVRRHLAWGRLYRATSYLKSALWTVPLVAIVLEQLLAPLVRALDAWLHWRLYGLELTGATALRPSSRSLSFLCSRSAHHAVAIPDAGGQLTSRIIATDAAANNVVSQRVGLFVFTLVFAVGRSTGRKHR
jgi:hypothetical protein